MREGIVTQGPTGSVSANASAVVANPADATRGIVRRGRATYGVDLGVMLLDADLPRAAGDVAHGATFDFAVHYEVTAKARVPHVIEDEAQGLLDPFIESGQRLIDRGATALVTSCGFLAIFQQSLVEALGVPVATSSLLQVPMLLRTLPDRQKVGLVTVNASTLGERHLAGAGITSAELARIVMIGLEGTQHFYQVTVGDADPLDVDRAESEVTSACVDAIAKDPSIGAFVLECTNLCPYTEAIKRATGRPVWDAVSLIKWVHAGVDGLATL
jgi:Asp/Glu/hydantoin racemase